MPDWRDFEQVVARIESILGGGNAQVRHPDNIWDETNGIFREVDASIRVRGGSAELLITVECRKRDGLEDVTWIEQLNTKRELIKAQQTIAVSSKGFSKSAVRTAARYGIELRVLENLTDSEIATWLTVLPVTVHEARWRLMNLRITLNEEGLPSYTQLAESAIAAYNSDNFLASLFKRISDDSSVSLVELLEIEDTAIEVPKPSSPDQVKMVPLPTGGYLTLNTPAQAIRIFEGVPADAKPHIRHYHISLQPDQLAVESTIGMLRVRSVDFDAELTLRRSSVPVGRIVRYTQGEQVVGLFAEAVVDAGPSGQGVLLSYRVDQPTQLDSPKDCR